MNHIFLRPAAPDRIVVKACLLICNGQLTLLRPVEWSVKFDTVQSGWSIIYIEWLQVIISKNNIEPQHEISNNVVCATSKASDRPAHTHSLIRAFASRLNIL